MTRPTRVRKPPIVDLRGELVVHATRRFARRRREDIRGVVFHQVLGGDNVRLTAKYHISKDCHVSPGVGCPGILYTYYVDKAGTIYLCNDIEAITWSQKGVTPLPMTKANTHYLAVVFGGDFPGKGHKGKAPPTAAQLESAGKLWAWLRYDLDLPEDMLFGHFDFGKPACPGFALERLIGEICAAGLDVKGNLPKTVKDWQSGLVRLGYNLGEWGPEKDGVDGSWGNDAKKGMAAFQTKEGLAVGDRDAPTAVRLATLLAALSPKKKRGGGKGGKGAAKNS